MKQVIFISFVLFVIVEKTRAVNNYICTEDYCEKYREEFGCVPLAEACQAQNSTLNGRIFPSATNCGCCEICLRNLNYDEDCSVGQPGLPFPLTICGPGLACTKIPNTDQQKCRKMIDSDCLREQEKFDKDRDDGKVGSLMQRPNCDGDGDFDSTKCSPGQTCYCLDRNGNRIFGESIHHAHIDLLMRCECSRLAAILPTLIKTTYPTLSARCDEMGSYDILQCVDDSCVCVDQNSGTPTSKAYNLTFGLSNMPCYNRKIHRNTTFLRECEMKKMIRIQELIEFEKDGWYVLGYENEMCQPDGHYAKLQITATHKFCADTLGNQIGNYIIERNEPAAKRMTCNCARARTLMEDTGTIIELPQCCPDNGNYERLACRRGQCYCVDDDGNQISLEEPADRKHLLDCYNSGNFCF